MSAMKAALLAATLLSLAAVALPASAQGPWYAGLSAGESRTSRELVHNRESTVTLASDFHTDFDDRDLAFKATVGYRFHPRFAVEVDYTRLGTHSLLANFLGGDAPAPASIFLERKVSGYGMDAVFFQPIAKDWSAFARVGAYRTTLTAHAELDGNVIFTNGDPMERARTTTRHETVARYGLGMQWEIETCSSLRVEWTRHADIGKAFAVGGTGTTGEADTDAILVGFLYRF
jgi:hypothetical protein